MTKFSYPNFAKAVSSMLWATIDYQMLQ